MFAFAGSLSVKGIAPDGASSSFRQTTEANARRHAKSAVPLRQSENALRSREAARKSHNAMIRGGRLDIAGS